MKLAITTTAPQIDAAADPRFGRAAAFCVIDTASGARETHPNPALDAASGAGVRAAQALIDQGVEAVISGAYGPKAHQVLTAAGLELYLVPPEVKELDALLERFQNGSLLRAEAVTHGGHANA